MIIFNFNNYEKMAAAIWRTLKMKRGRFSPRRFENQELYVDLESDVARQHCLIVGSVSPREDSLSGFTLLAHTLKKEGAGKVTALLPYLAYGRQDKDEPGKSLGIAWLGALLKASGVDEVVTVDVHSELDQELFPIPLMSISVAGNLSALIAGQKFGGATLVAPDKGALYRIKKMKIKTSGLAYFEKKRTAAGIIQTGPFGNKITGQVLVADDIIDTGRTLVLACRKLKTAGAKEILIYVTHGLFTGSYWQNLWKLGVKKIFCSSSVPRKTWPDAARNSPGVILAPIEAAVCEVLKKLSK